MQTVKSYLLLFIFFLLMLNQHLHAQKSAELRMMLDYKKTKNPTTGNIPKEKLLLAKYNAQKIKREKLVKPFSLSSTTIVSPLELKNLTWIERGPYKDSVGTSNGNTRANNDITAGRVRAILVDKADASGKTVWAAGVDGGLWKTTDITQNPAGWVPVDDDQFDNLSISDITQDPTNTNILYACTGESFMGYGEGSPSSIAVKGVGVFKSTDHGVTWSLLQSTALFATYSTKILCDQSGYVYLATRRSTDDNAFFGSDPYAGALRRSKDGGATWEKITPSGIYGYLGICDIELSSTGRFHVVSGILGGPQFYRYTDNPANVTSATWNAAVNPFPDFNTNSSEYYHRVELTSNGNVLYALPVRNSTLNADFIYKSTDGGVNWSLTTGQLSSPLTYGQAYYDMGIAINPTNPNECIVGGLDTWKTTDGGATWTQLSNWVGTSGQYVHADVHNITWYDNGNKLLIGSDGGIHYSSDKGSTIRDRNDGLRIKQFYSVAIHPTSTNYFLAGAQDNGTHLLTSAGLSQSTEILGGDGGFVAIDQDQPQFQFGTYVYNNFRRSSDSGKNWQYIDFKKGTAFNQSNFGSFINPYDYDHKNNIIYAGGDANEFFRWTTPTTTPEGDYYQYGNMPSGASFVTGITSFNDGQVSAIKVSPHTANRVYFGTDNGKIVYILGANNIATNNPVTTDITGATMTPDAYVSSINVGSSDQKLIASFSNYGINNIWVSSDGGLNWVAIDGDLPDMPVRWAMFYPGKDDKAIIGTEAGVYTTELINGASTKWLTSTSFPSVRTDMLSYRDTDRTLVAATHGRGLFTTILPDYNCTPASSSIQVASDSVCYGSGTTLSLNTVYDTSKYVLQWKVSSTSGGIFTDLGDSATQATGNLTEARYYKCTITCIESALTFTTTEKLIKIKPLPVIANIKGLTSVCIGSTIDLDNDTLGGSWRSLATSIATVNQFGIVTGVTSGTSTITYVVTKLGCVDSAIVKIIVNAIPSIPSIQSDSICREGVGTLYATPAAGSTIDWYADSIGGSPLLSGSTDFTTPRISTSTNYYAVSRNTSTGCVSNRVKVQAIVFNTNIQNGFNPLPDSLRINNADSTVLDAGAGFSSYQWWHGPTTQQTTIHNSDKYFIRAYDNLGCYAEDSIYVSIVNVKLYMPSKTEFATFEAGDDFVIALKADSTLWGWGGNDYGQLGIGSDESQLGPIQIGTQSDWVNISVGSASVLALKKDGTLWGWGKNTTNQLGIGTGVNVNTPIQIGTDNDWSSSFSMGQDYALAIKTNGTLWAWGQAYWGQFGRGVSFDSSPIPVQIGSATDWMKISAGSIHSLGIKIDSTLWAWGNNSNGQLGLGNKINKLTPSQIGTDNDWLAIKLSNNATMAMKSDKTVWAWGRVAVRDRFYSDSDSLTTPTKINSDQDWKSFTFKNKYALLIKENGTLWTWELVLQNPPINSFAGDQWDKVFASTSNVASKKDGSIWTWGGNSKGQIGNWTSNTEPYPIRFGTSNDWSKLKTGLTHVLASKLDSTTWVWGDNPYGEIGDGTTNSIDKPKKINLGLSIDSIYPSFLTTFGINNVGNYLAWGLNSSGNYGDGTTTASYIPTIIGVERNWKKVEGGYFSTFGLKSDSTLWSWGLYNINGQLGNGTSNGNLFPAQIATDKKWVDFSARSYDFGFAKKSDGTLWSWGLNEYNENNNSIGVNTSPVLVSNDTDWKEISVGETHILGLKTDNTIWGWASNSNGQIGDGTFTNRKYPVKINSEIDWKLIFAGSKYSLAIKKDGSLWQWGNNMSSPSRIGKSNDWLGIYGYVNYNYAIKKDNSLWVWGLNNGNNFNKPTTDKSLPFLNGFNLNNLMVDTTICAGDSVTLIATANIEGKTSWSTGDTVSMITVKPTQTTTYTASVTDSITTSSKSITVTVSGSDYNPFNDTTKVNGDSVILDAGSGYSNYLWSTGDSAQQITAKSNGKYKVSATSSNGCVVSDSTFVAITDSVGLFIPTMNAICGDTIQVPIRSFNFTKLLSMQGTISWDTTDLNFIGIADYGPDTLNLQPTNFGTTFSSNGKLLFSWNSETALKVDLPDSSTLFTIIFLVKPGENRESTIEFSNLPLPLEFINDGFHEKLIAAKNGTILLECSKFISGQIKTPLNNGVADAVVNVTRNSTSLKDTTDTAGAYSIPVSSGNNYIITPTKNTKANLLNGVTTLDIALTQAHILGNLQLDAPYKVIAADANNSGAVTTIDILFIRRLILGVDSSLPGNRTWTFVKSTHAFSDPLKPFPYPSADTLVVEKDTSINFIAVKLGDVNYDRDPSKNSIYRSKSLPLEFYYDTIKVNVNSGSLVKVQIRSKRAQEIMGFQFTLNWDKYQLHFDSISNNVLGVFYGDKWKNEGLLTVSWNDPSSQRRNLKTGELLFELVYRTTDQLTKTALGLGNEKIVMEAFDGKYQVFDIKLSASPIQKLVEGNSNSELKVFPNPAATKFTISFNSPHSGLGKFNLFDTKGALVHQENISIKEGANNFEINLRKPMKYATYSIQLINGNMIKTAKIVLRQ